MSIFLAAAGIRSAGAYVTDNFNRSNENLEASSNWTQVQSSGSALLRVSSNQLLMDHNSSFGGKTHHYEQTLASAQFAQLTIIAQTGSAFRQLGPIVRDTVGATDDTGYHALYRPSASEILLVRRDDGSETTLGTYSRTATANDEVRIEAVGDQIAVFLDTGSGFTLVIGPITDSNYSSGKAGVRGYAGSSSTVTGDNFICGEL